VARKEKAIRMLPEQQEPKGSAVERVASLQGRVLVVDDLAANRTVLATRLLHLGLTVEVASDGRDALRKLAAERFDLVFLDVMMPVMNGFETLRCIKVDPGLRDIPVLMISAFGEIASVVRCLELGAEDYLPKPFEPAVLQARVGACLEKKRLHDRERIHLEALRTERDRSERLLLNVLPRAIADRLKDAQTTIADSFSEVSILFADIVGFTQLASRVPPGELVGVLNDIFSDFDALLDRHGLEKIKTIGDAYLVAGGVPTPCPDHAAAVAEMALDMCESLDRFNLRTGASFAMRVGINSGPVVAGVIGTHKFIFDLWGDAVNIASRMESHGEPGRIQVSEATWQLLGDRYRFEERGVIEVKGKGLMRTFFLLGRQAT
jgi:class 3 adenylate cyclase